MAVQNSPFCDTMGHSLDFLISSGGFPWCQKTQPPPPQFPTKFNTVQKLGAKWGFWQKLNKQKTCPLVASLEIPPWCFFQRANPKNADRRNPCRARRPSAPRVSVQGAPGRPCRRWWQAPPPPAPSAACRPRRWRSTPPRRPSPPKRTKPLETGNRSSKILMGGCSLLREAPFLKGSFKETACHFGVFWETHDLGMSK